MGAILKMQPAAREDVSLVAETLSGNQLSFQLLVERYQDRMFGLVRHYTRNPVEIEDIVQDTFLKAFARLASFQQQSSFYTWLCRIAINTALDFHKRHGRNPVQSVEDPELTQGAEGASGMGGGARAERTGRSPAVQAPDARMEQREIQAITHRVLEELPEIFRTVLVLREFEDMAYQDMADVLGISIGTVESRLFRARARFKEKLLQLHPEFGEN
ncbi:MAG: sigma-70 family RNA polymerase sigma factor [Planctomycetes bacterium]|jgi:RNA polymerase sigma-70 factor (ECF subfamily)|nr:sigma-70 family RNA polymerase sigma factor [Planctomycetota bacterium]